MARAAVNLGGLGAEPPRDVPTDAALVALALAGDPEGFRAIYRRHAGRVRSLLTRMLGAARASDLDDVTQDVFLRVWQSLPTLREPQYLGTWIYRMALNAATDALRRSSIERRRTVDAEPAVTTDSAEQLHARRAIERALQALDFDHRAVLVLFDLEGVPQAELAGILGVPAGTVKSRLHHARRKVRELLASEGVEP